MPEEGERERPRCPECGAAYEPGAEQCPLCHAHLSRPTASGQGEGRLAAKPAGPRRTKVRWKRDLRASAARVEETVAAMAQPAPRPPAPRRAATAIVLGGLLCATGLVLFPVAFLVGWSLLVAGIVSLVLGFFLRYSRPALQ